MRSHGVNGDSYSSTEHCADCGKDYDVEVQTERITAETVTTSWTCPEGHGHEGELSND